MKSHGWKSNVIKESDGVQRNARKQLEDLNSKTEKSRSNGSIALRYDYDLPKLNQEAINTSTLRVRFQH